MDGTFPYPLLQAEAPAARQAAEILREELDRRTHGAFTERGPFFIRFDADGGVPDEDTFFIEPLHGGLRFRARGIRGLLYAVGLFLRKTEYRVPGFIRLTRDIAGRHAPQKPIRGHQLGYRPCSNTYDAWTAADFARYSRELAFFGINTVEHIPPVNGGERNALMRTDQQTLLTAASADLHALGLEVSLWAPNTEKDPAEALSNREAVFARTPYIDALFIPGSDPGDLPPAELFRRARDTAAVLRRYHPAAKLFVSAQAPHHAPGWGEAFLREAERAGDFLDGVITGPNRAFPIETLRRRLPARYPIRFYPDVTHNLRCEHPVHFDRDDWDAAFCAALSRESVNPRPYEYARLHAGISPYTAGSVTYSDGVNDDVNKAVWAALEWDADTPVREILEDWARLYLWDSDPAAVADAVAALERSWEGDPADNPQIDDALARWEALASPENEKNWRYLQGRFRARCDAFIRNKVLHETRRIRAALPALRAEETAAARRILTAPQDPALRELRGALEADADALHTAIGMQLSVSKHGAAGWERGATLDTIDNPVTDLPWLLQRLETAEQTAQETAGATAAASVGTPRVLPDEFYYSFAAAPLSALGEPQTPDFYMDVLCDRPRATDDRLPARLFKCFDHTALRLRRGGFLPGTDYMLTVTYKGEPSADGRTLRVSANGVPVWEGPVYGGPRDEEANRDLPRGFTAVSYALPAGVFENGCLLLELSEPEEGFETAELLIRRDRTKRRTQ